MSYFTVLDVASHSSWFYSLIDPASRQLQGSDVTRHVGHYVTYRHGKAATRTRLTEKLFRNMWFKLQIFFRFRFSFCASGPWTRGRERWHKVT